MKLTRLFTIAAFGAMAVYANAFNIAVQSQGTVAYAELAEFTETATFMWTSVPMPTLTDVDYFVTNIAPPTSGQAVIFNSLGDEIDLGITLQWITTSGSTTSGAGNWTYIGGTGAYAGLAGDGTFAFSVDEPSLTSFSSFVGTLESVPEPASIAILGMGAAALIGRRFKKSV